MDEADFSNASFCSAALVGAKLRRTSMYQINLGDADLTGASLCDSDMQQAQLQSTVLHKAKLKNVSRES